MLDRLVTKIGLDCSGIDAVVGQLEAAGVAQHVSVDLHTQSCSLTSALDHRLKATLGAADDFHPRAVDTSPVDVNPQLTPVTLTSVPNSNAT
jgi:hypothetical protein